METRARRDGPVLYATHYLIDSAGRLSGEEVRVAGSTMMRIVYRRDARRRVIEKCAFSVQDAIETPNGFAKLRYSGNKRWPIAGDDVSSDGSVAATYTFAYNKRGQETTRIVERAVGGTKRQERTYEASGKLERSRIIEKHDTTIIRYRYSPTGDRIEEILEDERDGAISVIRTYTKPCPRALLIEAS
jgi:hypothetical protein